MTALKVIGVILLILLLIACVRVRALARFGEKMELTLFIGPFRMTLLPEKEKKSAPDEEKKSGGEEKAKDAGKKKQRKLPKLTRAEGTVGLSMRVWDGLFIACALLAPLLKWYRRFRKAHKGDKAESSTAETAEKSEAQDGKLTA